MATVRRTTMLFFLLVAAGSLAFATGAAVVDGPADTVADGDLAIQPADGPNGQYAYLNDDDEIAIDVSASNPNIEDPSFEGVNVGTTGRIDDVFEITYTGEQFARVWVGHPNESVTFVADGDSIESEANNVTLATNETVAVGLVLDTRGAEAGTRLGADEFSIEAELAEPEDVTDASSATSGSAGGTDDGGPTTTVASPSADRREFVASDVERGGDVRFRADGMELAGDDVTLTGIDLEGVRTDRVELDAAGSRDPVADGSALTAPTDPRPVGYLSLDYEFAPDAVDAMAIRFSADPARLDATGTDPADVTLYRQTDAGDWEAKPVAVVDAATVDRRGLSTDRVHLVATTDDFSTFALATHVDRIGVREATVADATVEAGAETTVTATAENAGGAAGERTLTLTADGAAVDTVDVALEPGESTTVTFSAAFETTGTYDLAVEGTPVGELSVDRTASTETTPTAEGVGGSDDGGSTSDSGDNSSLAPPTDEPGGFGLADLGRLAALLAAVVAVLALARRRRRS